MPIKIKPCSTCWKAYTLPRFRTLELVERHESDGAETRKCAQCDTEMTVDVVAFDQLDLRTPLEMLSDEMARRRRERLRPRLLFGSVLTLALLLCVVAFRLWIR